MNLKGTTQIKELFITVAKCMTRSKLASLFECPWLTPIQYCPQQVEYKVKMVSKVNTLMVKLLLRLHSRSGWVFRRKIGNRFGQEWSIVDGSLHLRLVEPWSSTRRVMPGGVLRNTWRIQRDALGQTQNVSRLIKYGYVIFNGSISLLKKSIFWGKSRGVF